MRTSFKLLILSKAKSKLTRCFNIREMLTKEKQSGNFLSLNLPRLNILDLRKRYNTTKNTEFILSYSN